jgi:hypothetical protein
VDVDLDPKSEAGSWSVLGDTPPEDLDATDIGFLLPDGRIFYCHARTDPILFDPRTGHKGFPPASGSEQGCMNGTLLATAACSSWEGDRRRMLRARTHASVWT